MRWFFLILRWMGGLGCVLVSSGLLLGEGSPIQGVAGGVSEGAVRQAEAGSGDLRQGEAFDDRDLAGYFEESARGLWDSGKLKELKCPDQGCELVLPGSAGIRKEPRVFSACVERAESATVVFGAFQKKEKRKVSFGTAGGGFFVNGSGVCVTCRHVVSEKGIKGIAVLTRDGRVYPVKTVLASDPVEDVAVVQVELPEEVQVSALDLANWRVPVGAPVFVMSHPDERFYMLTTGIVSRHTLWREKNGVAHFMSVTADFAKGSSGCPVMDETGAVVGMVNNTESIYYDDDGRKKQLDLQMVVKNVTPAFAVRALFKDLSRAKVGE